MQQNQKEFEQEEQAVQVGSQMPGAAGEEGSAELPTFLQPRAPAMPRKWTLNGARRGRYAKACWAAENGESNQTDSDTDSATASTSALSIASEEASSSAELEPKRPAFVRVREQKVVEWDDVPAGPACLWLRRHAAARNSVAAIAAKALDV